MCIVSDLSVSLQITRFVSYFHITHYMFICFLYIFMLYFYYLIFFFFFFFFYFFVFFFFFFQAEDGIRDTSVTGVQTCALPILYSIHWCLNRLNITLFE